LLAELDGERQSDVAKTDDADPDAMKIIVVAMAAVPRTWVIVRRGLSSTRAERCAMLPSYAMGYEAPKVYGRIV